MSTMEVAEEMVTIMSLCSASYQKRYDEKPSDAILCMLTDRCHRQLISNDIQKQRSSVGADKEKKEGTPASDRQMKFIIDLGGDPHWTGTSYEASKYIDKLKAK